ncbi:MAG TPA: class I SAM-dependent methyltransferase [Candidatus Aquilonibacter sp.]|nr:class I SAM-dependent methyltransferase [Candidatus Aquilonibacter sp.]
MESSRPSRTAHRVAIRRAAHQVLDDPKVLDDPIAVPILDPESRANLTHEPVFMPEVAAKFMRAFMVVRSRFAEDELARAIARGATQYVILGAGLDTFAYRNPYPGSALHVFEVDHPATQLWKRERLAAGGIAVPPSLTFAPIDFEHCTLAEGLHDAGFEPRKITFFSWLGVIMYLTREAAISTLQFIASTPPGGGVVFDYALARESLNLFQKLALDRLMRRVEAAGEPFRLFFDPAELACELPSLGFAGVEDLGVAEINARYFANRADGLRVGGGLGRLISATL